MASRRNDNFSTIFAKSAMNGYVPSVSDTELDVYESAASELFKDDLVFNGKATRLFRGLKENAESNRSSTVFVMGDSTGNGTDEWVYLFGQHLAAKYPSCAVRHRLWNIGTESWDAPTIIQNPSDRYVQFDGTTGAALTYPDSPLNSITNNLDIRIKCASNNWSAAGLQSLVTKFGAGGNRSFRFSVNTGNIQFDWTVDGSTIQPAANSGAIAGLVNGTPVWLRVTFEGNNAGNTVITFYKSTDGTTWTQTGTPVSRAGTSSIFDSTQDIELASRGGGAIEFFNGKIYEVEVRNGLNGANVVPTLPEFWTQLPSTYNGVLSGSPTIDIWNGSGSGYSTFDMNDSVRAPKMIFPLEQSVTLISDSHNEAGLVGSAFFKRMDTLITNIRNANPYTPIGIVGQNPKYSPASYIGPHANRVSALRNYADYKGATYIDVYNAFGTDRSLVNATDGIHPTPAGSLVWASVVKSIFNAA